MEAVDELEQGAHILGNHISFIVSFAKGNRSPGDHGSHCYYLLLELIYKSLLQNSISIIVVLDSRFGYPCLIFCLKL